MINDSNRLQPHLIDIALARRLRDGGLVWTPAWHDFFAIPDSNLDERVFVLSDMAIDVQIRQGWPALTFNGAVEWSLDYVMQADVVWLPTESQLRHMLQVRLAGEEQPAVTLNCQPDVFVCAIQHQGQPHTFSAVEAADAYGMALLYLLRQEQEDAV